MLVLRDIASLMSEQSGDNFSLSMNNILKFKDLLLDGKFVEVSELYENIDDSTVTLKENNDNNEITEHVEIAENSEIIDSNGNIRTETESPTDPPNHQVLKKNQILMKIDFVTNYKSRIDDSVFYNDHSYCKNNFETLEETTVSNSNLDRITIPKVDKTRGRPKGCTKTVIGLPKYNCQKKKPFNKRTASEKKIVYTATYFAIIQGVSK